MKKDKTDKTDGTPRFDKSLDRDLYNDVGRKIEGLYDTLHERKENVPFTMHDLAEALVAEGYAVDDDAEHASPYLQYVSRADYLTLVRLHHGDCCIMEYGRDDVRIFADQNSYNTIQVRDTDLAQTVSIIGEIDDALPDIVGLCREARLKAEKKAKQLSISKSTVRTVVAAALKGTGIGYNLYFSKRQALLVLRLDHGLETNLYLPYNDFMRKIPYIKSTVEQLNGIMRDLGQPLRIKGTYYQMKDSWTEPE